jgi:hypothetical protein
LSYSVEHRARRLQRQLEALGYNVTLQATEHAQPADWTQHDIPVTAVGPVPTRTLLPKRRHQLGDSDRHA